MLQTVGSQRVRHKLVTKTRNENTTYTNLHDAAVFVQISANSSWCLQAVIPVRGGVADAVVTRS